MLKGKLIIVILIIVFASSIAVLAEEINDPLDEKPPEQMTEQEYYYRGRVLSIEESEELDKFNQEYIIKQELDVEITNGPLTGEVVNLENRYQEGHYYYNLYLEEGMDVILTSKRKYDLENIYLHDMARDRGILYLTLIFVISLLLVGRMKGLKTLITLIFSALIIIKVMLPLMLAGNNPIIVAVLSAITILIPTFLLISGFNKKSLAAIIGTSSGVLIAGVLAFWAGKMMSLTGFAKQEAQMLLVMDQTIDVQGLLFAGIIIGSLGAITDVCMSIASAMAEIDQNNLNLKKTELISSGLNVGRDIMGTMTNTLLLAYTGSAIPLLLLMLGADMAWIRIVNLDLIATEFVKGLTGSIGLVISIPITAVVAGILLKRNNK